MSGENGRGTGVGRREFAIAGAAGLVGAAVMTPVLAAHVVYGHVMDSMYDRFADPVERAV